MTNNAATVAQLKDSYTTVVIGTGFGGSMTGLTLAKEYQKRGLGEDILMLERGSWWTTPVGTVQDKEVKTPEFLSTHGQPWQYWSSAENFKGLIDIVTRCLRRRGNEDGLYDITNFEKKGLLFGLIGSKNDGVSVLRASGVGGGSLVYANVTIQPPHFIFDEAWPEKWRGDANTDVRQRYYTMARDAIGHGVLFALDTDHNAHLEADQTPVAVSGSVNAGLSRIAARTARINPRFSPVTTSPDRQPDRIDLKRNADGPEDPQNLLWLPRARVFQTAMGQMTEDYGTVQSSINDLPYEPIMFADNIKPTPYAPGKVPMNFCERQGRCLVGCLPGARHTLNKQLMGAALGKPDGTPPVFTKELQIQALAEVDYIEALADGDEGYIVHYKLRDPKNPSKSTARHVRAKVVVVAAGCLGTNEIMLRSGSKPGGKAGLPHLSKKVGYGFSTNGDKLSFLPNTKQHFYLTKGPITTSYGHFNSEQSGAGSKDVKLFHTVEDNGIPRALASVANFGIPLLQTASKAHSGANRLAAYWTVIRKVWNRAGEIIRAPFKSAKERQPILQSEDEMLADMMCVAVNGRSAADGEFRLGKSGETTLRVSRPGGKDFADDDMYREIDATLGKLGEVLGSEGPTTPWETKLAKDVNFASTALTHPLGGCRMADTPEEGVCDAFGRVFFSNGGSRQFYKNLYISDAALMPSSLGVNPSLTISAVALRAVKEWLATDLAVTVNPPPGP